MSSIGRIFGSRGGGGGNTQITTQRADPWPGQQPFLLDIFNRAQGAAQRTSTEPVTGDLVAQPTDLQRSANVLGTDVGLENLGLGEPTFDLADATIAGDFLDPSFALTPALHSALNPIVRRMQEELLPAIGTEAQRAGAYGGSDMDWAKLRLIDTVSQNFADAATRAGADMYGRERALQQAAPDLLTRGYQQELMPVQTIMQAGSTEQNWEQDFINNVLAQHNMNQAAPWAAVGPYSSILQGFNPGAVREVSSPRPSRAGDFLGGAAAGGLGAYGAGELLNIPWLTGPWGVGSGALAGGLAGLLL